MRTERKYITSLSGGHVLAQRAEMFAERDPYCSNGPYCVETIYFDTPRFDMLNDKLNGEHTHIKIRARRYNRSSSWFVESKIKQNSSEHKVRFEAGPSVDLMTDSHPEALRVLWAGLRWVRAIDWVPRVMVQFSRLAFNIPGKSTVRLNFDNELIARSVSERHPLMSGHTIVEVKSATRELPRFLEHELGTLGGGAVTFSKYAAAMEALERP